MITKPVDESDIHGIMKLVLTPTLICEGKRYPIVIKGRARDDGYLIMVETGGKDINDKKCQIELKGQIDVQSVHYMGTLALDSVSGQSGEYRMSDLKLFTVDRRAHKRVPYRRKIHLTYPIDSDEILINLSASGALIYSNTQIDTEDFKFELTLMQKKLKLDAVIVEQFYIEKEKIYGIRCYFDKISHKDQKLISMAVKEIILKAKARLRAVEEQKEEAKKEKKE